MDLNDLYKLAGIPRDDAPAIEPQPVEQPVAEQPMDGRDDMKAMIALVTPEQLNRYQRLCLPRRIRPKRRTPFWIVSSRYKKPYQAVMMKSKD